MRCMPIAAPAFQRARAVFRYDDASRPLVLRFKLADRTGAAQAYARWMARSGAELLAGADLLVPVPLHPWRLLMRRYNQSALIANALSKLTGLPTYPETLRRIRWSGSQRGKGRKERRRTVYGVFQLSPFSERHGETYRLDRRRFHHWSHRKRMCAHSPAWRRLERRCADSSACH